MMCEAATASEMIEPQVLHLGLRKNAANTHVTRGYLTSTHRDVEPLVIELEALYGEGIAANK